MTLEKEFCRVKEAIKQHNKNLIVFERMIPYLRTHFLETEGYLKTDDQLLEFAQSLFELAQENGIIDDLNNVIEEVKV